MSISKDLLLQFIESNCDKKLYEYYKEFVIVFLWNVIMTNGCMSILRALLLYFIECNCDELFYGYYEGSIVVLY